MKRTLNVLALCLLLALPLFAQNNNQDDIVTVTVPRSSLSPQQQATLQQEHAKTWIGIGKEFGDAVNTGLAAVTTQSNNFAQTPVGKVTVFLIAWKILGDQVIHFVGGIAEVVLFVPIWIWSYRRMCMSRRIKTGKDTWQVVEYKATGEVTPRIAHWVTGMALIATMLITVFSY
jgi:hypothetical protein